MSSSFDKGWEAVRLEELDEIPVAEGVVWRPLRRRLGIRAFGTNAYTSEGVGQHIVEDHDELGSGAGGHEEMYVVVSGRARFTIAGEDLDAPAGTVVFLRDPAIRRVAIAEEEGTVCSRSAASRAGPTRSRRGSGTSPRSRVLRGERWEQAILLLEEGLRENPKNSSLLYNLACAESRAGRTADAIAHLTEALQINPKNVEDAKRDPDFDPIRGEPGFPA